MLAAYVLICFIGQSCDHRSANMALFAGYARTPIECLKIAQERQARWPFEIDTPRQFFKFACEKR